MRRALHRRLRTLRNLELFNVVFLPAALSYAWRGSSDLTARYLALALVCGLLVQGGVYWHLKLRSVSTGRPIAAMTLHRYRLLDQVIPCLLGSAALGFTLSGALGWTSWVDAIWALALTGFAGLEYLNYFRVQLAHDSRRDLAYLWRWGRLRTASLADDLRRNEPA